MVIQVHFPVIFLFINIIKRRILIFFYYETYWLNVKIKAYWVIQQRIIIYTLFETLPIQNIKNKTIQTNKQTKFLGKWNWLIKIQKKTIVKHQGRVLWFCFCSHLRLLKLCVDSRNRYYKQLPWQPIHLTTVAPPTRATSVVLLIQR